MTAEHGRVYRVTVSYIAPTEITAPLMPGP